MELETFLNSGTFTRRQAQLVIFGYLLVVLTGAFSLLVATSMTMGG